MFKTTLSNIDLFSIAPILMYKGSTKINSLAGGLFSLVAFICLFISCIYFSKDLYNRTNPQTFTKKIISTNISFFNISYNKNLTIAIQNPHIFENGNSIEKNENRIFDFKNSYKTEDNYIVSPYIQLNAAHKYLVDRKTDRYETVYLNIYNCSEHYFTKGFLCIDLNNTYLGNGNIHKEIPENYVHIYIDICRNKSHLPFKCKTESQIREWISKTEYLLILKPEIQVELDDFDNPIANRYSIEKIPIQIGTLFERTLYYDAAFLNTDSGIIFEEMSYINFLQFYLEEDIYETRTKEDYLIKIKMNMSNNSIYYTRNFVKVQQVFANIGGILQLIISVFKIISNGFVQKSYNIKLSRQLWDHDSQVVEGNISKDNIFKKNGQNAHTSQNSRHLFRKSVEVSIDLTNKYSKTKEDKFLNYTIFEYVTSVICLNKCKNEKLKKNELIYRISKNRIDRRLDIVEIIRYFIEIDRLKYILFNETQINSLNYLRNKKVEFNIEYIQDEIKNENSIIDNYNNLLKNIRSFKRYDNKILSLLEKKIYKL